MRLSRTYSRGDRRERKGLLVVFLCALCVLGASTSVTSVGSTSQPSRSGQDLRLWYQQPAANWNEALPIGNGRLGAMVFGGIAAEHLQLNEDTVWAGEKRDRMNPAGPAAVKEVRRLLAEGKAAEAEALADKAIIATPRRMPPYQPLGDLTIDFDGSSARREYRREVREARQDFRRDVRRGRDGWYWYQNGRRYTRPFSQWNYRNGWFYRLY